MRTGLERESHGSQDGGQGYRAPLTSYFRDGLFPASSSKTLDSLIVLQRSGATGDCLAHNMKTWADFLPLLTRTWGAVPTGTPFSSPRGKPAPARGEIREAPHPSHLRAAACPSRSPGICGATPRTGPPGSSSVPQLHRPPPSCVWRSEPPCPPRSRSAGPRSGRCN